MDEKQLQQIVSQVQQALQQGAKPEEVMQSLVQQGMPQEVAQQVMQAAMQSGQGGEGMQGSVNTQREAQQLIETALGELGPEVLAALLMAYDTLDDANKQALQQQLQQMVQQGKSNANGQQGQPQEEQATAVQENLFGRV